MSNGTTRSGFKALLFTAFILVLSCAQATQAETFDLGLIPAEELRAGASGWVVLDARPADMVAKGHIPGARPFSWQDYTRNDSEGIPYRILPPKEMAEALGALGIDENTPVVVYGDADESWGGEGWACWALCSLGHKGPVRLLDGGLHAWTRAGFPLAKGEYAPAKRRTYTPAPRPGVDISTEEIATSSGNRVLIDTRSTMEWILGRLPNAVHIAWEDMYDGEDRRPLSPERFRALLQEHGVDPRSEIVYYCTGGIRSGYAWTVHQLASLRTAENYEGGTEAWNRRK